MIISRTPFRMSFFGGGTDYPAWYREHGGAVLSTSIDKYCYISCRYLPPFFDHKSKIIYSKVETVRSNDQIEHPAVRAVLKHLAMEAGIEIHHDGDLPARAGLGSSSAFAVGLLNAVYALKNSLLPKLRLAREAIHVEQEILRENVGCQDQVIVALGGLRRIEFGQNGEIEASPVPLSQRRLDEFQDHLLLCFTGFSRTASVIVQEQLSRMREKERELKRMREMVDEGLSILSGERDLKEFGRLLDEAWTLKRSLSSRISTPVIDEAYEKAKSAGALGGKLLGAGGGGFLLLFAEPGRQAAVLEALKGLLRIPFRFEHEGSQLIFYEPDSYQPAR